MAFSKGMSCFSESHYCIVLLRDVAPLEGKENCQQAHPTFAVSSDAWTLVFSVLTVGSEGPFHNQNTVDELNAVAPTVISSTGSVNIWCQQLRFYFEHASQIRQDPPQT